MTRLEDFGKPQGATKKPVDVRFAGPFQDPGVVETIEGDFEVDEAYIEEHGGYVVIEGVEDELYPCALDVFLDTYDVLPGDSEAGINPDGDLCIWCGRDEDDVCSLCEAGIGRD